MKTPTLIAALALSALAKPAFSDHHQQPEAEEEQAPQAEVIERDADGKATRVRVDGREYAVCGEGQEDECINPREAGLDFGDVPIDYWPGQPASEIDHPLPQHAPPPPDDDDEG